MVHPVTHRTGGTSGWDSKYCCQSPRSARCALLDAAGTGGWATVHTGMQSVQICWTWHLRNMGNSYYGATALGLWQDSGQPRQGLKEIENSQEDGGGGKKKKKTKKNNPSCHLTSSWSTTLQWHKTNSSLPIVHSNQVLLTRCCKW